MNKDNITEEDFGFSERVCMPQFEIVHNFSIKLSELGSTGKQLKKLVDEFGEEKISRLLNSKAGE